MLHSQHASANKTAKTSGALFRENDPCQQAFVLSVNAVNKLRRTTDDLANVHFVPDSRSTTSDVFETSQSGEQLMSQGKKKQNIRREIIFKIEKSQ